MHAPSLFFASTLIASVVVIGGCGPEPEPAAPRAPTVAPAPKPSVAPLPAAGRVPARKVGTTKRVVVSLGRTSGSSLATVNPDESISIRYDVLENGRGPKVDASLRLGTNGAPLSFEAKGKHTMGTPVEESFQAFVTKSGRARWKSHEESGEAELGNAFYVPVAELPDMLGFLAEALIKAGGKMPLLPAGEARIEKTGGAIVKSAAGETRNLVSYSIVGLDLVPTHVWMNEDGTWFGVTYPWWSVVPEGWELNILPLVAKQDQYDRERDAQLAKDVAHKPPAAGLAYTHARVLDVAKGAYVADQTVVIVGDKITEVGPTANVKPPKDAEIVDLGGKALLPGLWDMHAHLGDADGALNIACGVTTARDVGNDPDKLDDFKKRYDEGTAVGPHVLRFGFIEGRGQKAASSTVTAENETEAKAAVEFFKKRNYEGIKIYNSMKPELVPILAKEAHAKKMMVTGHIPVHMLANEAVKAGYDGIEHINMLFLNFLADHETDTRDTTRFTLVGDKAGSLDLKSKPVLDFIGLLKQRQTVIDPTLDAFEMLLVAQQGKLTPGTEDLVARLPVQAQRGFLTGGVPFAGKEEAYRQAFDKLLAMVKALYEAKVPVVAGTDMTAGLMLHHELALFVRAGISPAVALRLATLEPARTMKLDSKTGSIAKGKAADLFVVDGDPLAKIEDLRKVTTTMRGGIVFPPTKLLESVGVKP